MIGKSDQADPQILCPVVVRVLNEGQYIGRLMAGIQRFRFLQSQGTWRVYRLSEGMNTYLPHLLDCLPGILEVKPPMPRAIQPIDCSLIRYERKGVE